MGDILEPLKSFQLNYLYLMRLIPIRDICIEILKQKKNVEEIETYNYHYDMWETHAGKYYECLDKDRTDRRERFIYSVARFLNKNSLKKIYIERVTQEDIKIALLFGCPKIEILEKDDIKIFSYPSVDEICRTTSAKKEFLMRCKEDLI